MADHQCTTPRLPAVGASTHPSATVDFSTVFSASPTASVVLTGDLVMVEPNSSFLAVTGRTRDDLVGRPLFEAFPPSPDDTGATGYRLLLASLHRTLDTGEPTVLPLHRYDLWDPATGQHHERHWSAVTTALPGADGVTRLLLHQVEDVTGYVRERTAADQARVEGDWRQRVQAVEAVLHTRVQQLEMAQESARTAASALQASEQRARAVLNTAVDAIMTIDARGLIQSVNPATERMFGYSQQEMVGRNIMMLMPEPYRSHHDSYLSRYQRTGERRIIGSGREVAGQRRNGEVFPIELAVSEVGCDPPLFTGMVRDITDRKRLEAQLVHQSLHDPLTGLANRALLVQRLDLAAARLARRPGMLALLFVDLDRFKLVNDTLGHDAGDDLLKETAVRLRGGVRPEDLVARLGGDEFVVLCEDLSNAADAETVAARVVRTLAAPMELRGREIHVSASVGVVTDRGGRSAAEVLGDADAAMYLAKENGRGRYSLLDAAARASTSDRLELGSDLHHALERDELRAGYQPLVDLRTGAVVAAEALLRWEHPRRGSLFPHAFLDVATDLGLTADLDSWIRLVSCHQAAEWTRQLQQPVGVWVNLSSQSLADRRLPHAVASALEESGLEPALLTLEITEGGLMQDAPETVRALTTLRGLGVRLAVDDFGTGYSSLSYLQRFPVHSLKVDRSFVERLDQAPSVAADSAAIIAAIVNLAAALGLQTVAEGVETPEQLTAVTALGCDVAQGFFLGRPTAQENIPRAMRNGVVLTPSTDNPLPRQRTAAT